MCVRLKGINSRIKVFVNGEKCIYWYVWKGGLLFLGKFGDFEFIVVYNEVVVKKVVLKSGSL